MRALLITVGSRGDAEPFQALVDALTARGHSVDFFLQAEHDFVPAHPELVTLHALPFSTTDFYKHAANPRHGQDSDNPRVKFVGVIVEVISQLVLPCMEDVSRVAKDCDVVVCSSLPRHMCFCIGKALHKPVALLHLQPMAPTKAFPHYSSGETVECILKGLSSEENEKSYEIPEQCNFDFLQESLATAVASTGSAMINFDEVWKMLTGAVDSVVSFNCFSADLCPSPTHGHIHDIGALADTYRPSNFVAPPELVEFLAERKPVAIGFGSMPFQGAQGVISGLETLDYPAVLVGQAMTNYEETEWTKKNVMQVNSVAYPWLLPQCRCMVSHGGAGVLHSTLRAGIPAIIAPFFGDQFFHAKLIQARELGTDAGAMNSLSAEGLVETLKLLDTPQGAQWLVNAQAFASKIQDKNAPLELVKHLENLTR